MAQRRTGVSVPAAGGMFLEPMVVDSHSHDRKLGACLWREHHVRTERDLACIGRRFFYPSPVPTAGEHAEPVPNRSVFATTHWSVVLAASQGQGHTPQSATALEQLCRTYWYPLYAHVRRRGYGPEDAEDLTQDFFAQLIAKDWVGMADPARGRFRSFVLAALDHFLANQWHRAHRQKRGGDHVMISWDQRTAENRYLAELVDDLTPDRIFERRWAEALLAQVLLHLRDEYATAGKQPLFETVKDQLWGEKAAMPRTQLAATLGLTEGALKVAIHRMRRRYRELLRFEVAQTVSSPEAIDTELRELMDVLRG